MLISDSSFTPPSSPRSTEISATAVMPVIRATCTDVVGDAEYVFAQAGIRLCGAEAERRRQPEQRREHGHVSMTWPHQPQTRSPRIG